jgi:glycosyltransferase involved in cell wall biosynthesis
VPLDIELICVDDGSIDGTRDGARAAARRGRHRHAHPAARNRGKGAAVRRGIQRPPATSSSSRTPTSSTTRATCPRLLEPIADGRADAVFGSRFLGGPHRVLYFWHSVGNGALTLLSNMFTDLNLTDMETCYKMARADLHEEPAAATTASASSRS